jgi:hypothetical protein
MRVAEQSDEYSESNSDSGDHLGVLRNALVGGAVAVLLSFLPLSQVLGGGVAGYLERGVARRGHAAGAVAGVVGYLPYFAGAVYLALSPGVALPGPALEVSREFLVAAAAVAFVYVVGLSVLGSVLGGSLRDEG